MSTRAQVAVPWSVAVGLGALAAAGWLRSPEAPSSPFEEGAARVTLGPDAGATAAAGSVANGGPCADAGVEPTGAVLALCLERLAASSATGEARALSLDTVDAGVDPAALACLARLDVAALARTATRAELARESTAARAARGRAVEGAIALALGATDEDLEVMGDSVCAARALRDRTLAGLEAGSGDATAALQDLRAERDAALADIEARLGPERYATFRSLGGIGMLAEVLDCETR